MRKAVNDFNAGVTLYLVLVSGFRRTKSAGRPELQMIENVGGCRECGCRSLAFVRTLDDFNAYVCKLASRLVKERPLNTAARLRRRAWAHSI